MKNIGFFLCATLAFLAMACGSHHDSTSNKSDIHATAEAGGPASASCQAFIKNLPKDFIHGFVTVPENPQQSGTTEISIFYYGHLIDGVTPVMVFNGGPTENSRGDYSAMIRYQNAHPDFKNVPLLFMDQRGTGCSTPYPTVKLWGDIDRLQAWGSAGIVYDAEAVRRALLGDKPWKILGQSYGGNVVHRYAQLAASSLISASSHGYALTTDPLETLEARIESQKKTVDAYLAKYPGDQATLDSLNAQLTVATCFTDTAKTHKQCGHQLFFHIYDDMGFLDEWSIIHSWLVEMQKDGGGHITQKYIDQFEMAPSYMHTNAALDADSVIWFTDMNVASHNKANCDEVYSRLQAKGEEPQNWPLNECQPDVEQKTAALSNFMTYVNQLPRQLIEPASFKHTLQANPSLKFYLYSGELDPYSPVATFSEEVQTLGSLIHYTDFQTTGHDGFFSEGLVWQNLMKD